MIEINDRVACIKDTNNRTKQCLFLGYGIYEGKYVPIGDNISKNAKRLARDKRETGKFKLDDGNIVYATDCWFMLEERFKEVFINDCYDEGWKVIKVNIKGRRIK